MNKRLVAALAWLFLGIGVFAADANERKLDPSLRLLSGAQAGPTTPDRERADSILRRVYGREIARDAERATLPLILKFSGSRETLEAAGLRVQARVGDVYTGYQEKNRLADLAKLPGVSSLQLSQVLWATVPRETCAAWDQVDWAGPAAASAPRPEDSAGTGVLIAFVDTGADIFHQDFRKADGTTRIKYLLDLSEPGDTDGDGILDGTGPYGGTEWSETEINAAIASNTFPSKDPTGHGTHGLSVAAGDDPSHPGMAPGADLLVVKATRVRDSLAFESADLISALEWVDQKADLLGMPCVINLSLGTDLSSHDGRSLEEQAIDQVAGMGVAGRAVVAAAGNGGGHDAGATYHLRAQAQAGLSQEHLLTIPAYTPNPGTGNDRLLLDIWYARGAELDIAVVTPLGTTVQAAFGSVTDQATAEGSVLILNQGWPMPGSGDMEAMVLVDDYDGAEVAQGGWKVRVTGRKVHHRAVYDAWVTEMTSLGELSGRPSIGGGDNLYYIGKPGSSFSAITVGSYALDVPGSRFLTNWTDVDGNARLDTSAIPGAISGFSSSGMTRDGRVKPDLAAPGERVLGAVSRDAYPTGDPAEVSVYKYHPWYPAAPEALIVENTADDAFGVLQGTSFSAPVVTGLAARVLSGHPTWDGEQVRNALIRSAAVDAFTGSVPNGLWGWGKAAADLGGATPIPPSLRVATPNLPTAHQGHSYSGNLTATGGQRPYVWSEVGSNLPAGLFVDPLGRINGTPSASGIFHVTVRVTDAVSISADATLELEVRPDTDLEILTDAVPTGSVGVAYTAVFEAEGGIAPYTWTLEGGDLPPGLSLGSNGLLAGTPTQAGDWSCTIRVSDGASHYHQRSYDLTVELTNNPDWDQRGLMGGTILKVVINPVDSETLFAGTDGNGLYVSQNRGRRWSRLEDIPRITISDITFSPGQANIMFVATLGDGIYKSSDGGVSWSQVLSGQTIFFVVVDFDDPSTIYAGSLWNWYISRDGGVTWITQTAPSRCEIGSGGARYFDFVQDPVDHERLYISTFDYTDNYGWVWFSSDRGVTWDMSPNGLESGGHWRCSDVPDHAPFHKIALSPLDHQIIVGTVPAYGRIYRSVDRGVNWVSIPAGVPADIQFGPQTGWIYLGSDGIERSADGGASFTDIATGRPGWNATTVYSVAIDGTDESKIYAGTDRGLYYSQDGGQTWVQRIAGMMAANIVDGDVSAATSCMSTIDGVFEAASGSAIWSRLDAPANIFRLRFGKHGDPSPLLLATRRRIYLRDTSGNLQVISGNIPGASDSQDWIVDLGIGDDGANDKIVCLTTQRGETGAFVAYSSINAGASWSSFEVPLNFGVIDLNLLWLIPVGDLYFGAYGYQSGYGFLLRSADNGSTWTTVLDRLLTLNFIGERPSDGSLWMTIHQRDSNTHVGDDTSVYMSTDGGQTFERKQNVWYSSDFRDIVFRTRSSEELFMGTAQLINYWGGTVANASGVIYSNDEMASMAYRNTGFPYRTPTSRLLYDEQKDLLVAGTRGAGVFTSWDGGLSWQETNTFTSIAASVQDIEAVDAMTMVLGSKGYGCYASSDGGATFSPNNQGLAGGFDVRSLVRDGDGVLWAATGGGVYSQATIGGTWTKSTLSGAVTDIAVDGTGTAKRIWAVVTGQGVAYSVDGGSSFTVSSAGLSTLDLTGIEIENLGSAKRIWAVGHGGDGAFYSDDDGATWVPVTGVGLGNHDVNGIAVETGAAKRIWAVTEDGVYISMDDGRTWQGESAGLPGSAPVTSITFDASTGEALVSVKQASLGGVFRGGNLTGTWRPFNSGLEDRRVNRVVQGATYTSGGTVHTSFHAGTDGGGLFSTDISNVSGAPVPSITTVSVPDGYRGESYRQALSATGGTPPYAWGLSGGNPPAGVVMRASGEIAGTPVQDGVFSLSPRVSDANQKSATKSLTLSVFKPVLITNPSLPDASRGEAYAPYQLVAEGGKPPLAWAIASRDLPEGMSLSGGGVLSGTPSEAGSFPVIVRATDANGRYGEKQLSLNVSMNEVSAPGAPVPFTLTLDMGGSVTFRWEDFGSSATAYNLYSGPLGSFGSAVQLTCHVAGTLDGSGGRKETTAVGEGNLFFLVTASDASKEMSPGRDSSGNQRTIPSPCGPN